MADLMQPQRERVGRQIRKARKGAGLSHDRLACKVGTSRHHLIRIEKGMHLPRPDLLAKIAEATGKPESFFTSDDDDEDPSSMPAARDLGDLFEQLLAPIVDARVNAILAARP